MRHFILCAQLLFGMRGATATLCPDGSAGLTKALYEAGNATAYQDVTCIPDGEFNSYARDVTLNGLQSLKSIGEQAFEDYVGKFTFTGDYPALETIGSMAFNCGSPSGRNAGNAGSVIRLKGLPSLKSIGGHAFAQFAGRLTFTGEYPALETISSHAFISAGNAGSAIRFTGLQSLKSIKLYAFNYFGGTLTVTGEYPNYQGCTRVGYGMNPDPDIVLHAPDQIPLTKTMYEEAAASGVGGGVIQHNVHPRWRIQREV